MVKKLWFLLLFSFLPFFSEIKSQQVEDLGYFGEIVDFHFMDSSTIAIVSNNFENHVSIFSLDTKKIIRQYIPKGRGPEEALSVESSALFEKMLYLKEPNGQITTIDLISHSIEEKFALPAQGNFMTVTKEILAFGSQFIINPNMVERSKFFIPIGYILNRETLQIIDTVKFDLKKLEIDGIRNVNHIENLFIKTYIQPVSSSEYFLAFEGDNRVFLINPTLSGSNSIIKEFKIDLPNIIQLKVIKNDAYGYGLRYPASLTNFFTYDTTSGKKIAFSYGNQLQKIPLGYAVYQSKNESFIYKNIKMNQEILNGTYSFKKKNDLILGYIDYFGNLFKFN